MGIIFRNKTMKNFIVIGAIIASASAIRLNDDDEEHKGDFPHWMNGFGGYKTYKRDIPDRFEAAEDDLLMKSMYQNYATEGKDKKTGQPNGHFWVTAVDAERAADEVVGTHLHLQGSAKDAYVKENYASA